MSVETPSVSISPPIVGEYNTGTELSVDEKYDIVKKQLHFVEPSGADSLLAGRFDASGEGFDSIIRDYIELYLKTHEEPIEKPTDVYDFRGILVSVSHLYYERCVGANRPHGSRYRAMSYTSKEYLRTVLEDMRILGETPSTEFNDLLVELGVRQQIKSRSINDTTGEVVEVKRNFPDPFTVEQLMKFNQNVMYVLSKIDPNIIKLDQSRK